MEAHRIKEHLDKRKMNSLSEEAHNAEAAAIKVSTCQKERKHGETALPAGTWRA